MEKSSIVKTGDVLLFSGNTPTGFLLRTFVSSEWNHSGIAVRFITKKLEDGSMQYEVSLTEEGELYILETNTGERRDDIFGDTIIGAGFSRANWAFAKYERVATRRLHDIFRTPHLAEKTMQFAKDFRGYRFPSNNLPFIGVWLGITLADKTASPNDEEMFCSELMAHYYINCVGSQYTEITGIPFDNKLSTLFGNGSPSTEDMYTPEHYTSNTTPNAAIFTGTEEIIYTAHADLLYVVLQPLVIITIVAIIIWLTLPH